jgi:hypothetical protein
VDSARETKLFSRIWRHLAAGLGPLRDNGWPVIQTAVAAAVAYFLATFVLDIEYMQAFYVPIAAVVCLSLSLGQPKRRALLVTIGVAVGLTVAYFIVLAIGIGPVQIGIVVALAMAAALLVSGRTLLINQAAISAILVVVLQPPQQSGFSPDRFLDALVGGGVALAINYLFPADPKRMVERAARPIFDELVSTLEEIAVALKDGDRGRAARALSQGRGIDEQVSGFGDTLRRPGDGAVCSTKARGTWAPPTLRRRGGPDRPDSSWGAKRGPGGYGRSASRQSCLGSTLGGRT